MGARAPAGFLPGLLAASALLCLTLASPVPAQEVPIEVPLRPPPPSRIKAHPRLPQGLLPCPGCDCRGEGCFHPNCGCGGKVDDAVGAEMLTYVQHLLHQAFQGQLDLARPVRVRAVSPAQLSSMAGGEVYGLYADDVLYVSNGVSRVEALGILAHEYGHAWQYQHNPDPDAMSAEFSEGFAEWVAYQVLTRAGDFGTASIIRRNGDPTYGDGFRWYFGIEKEHGVYGVLRVAVNWRDTEGHPAVAGADSAPADSEPPARQDPAAPQGQDPSSSGEGDGAGSEQPETP